MVPKHQPHVLLIDNIYLTLVNTDAHWECISTGCWWADRMEVHINTIGKKKAHYWGEEPSAADASDRGRLTSGFLFAWDLLESQVYDTHERCHY